MKQTISLLHVVLLTVAFLSMGSTTVLAQNYTYRGNVTDESGEPLIGATIAMKGQANVATVTDIDGNFTLHAPEKQITLMVTYVGMESKNIRQFGIRICLEKFQFPTLFNAHGQCLWLILEETVCSQCRTEIHEEVMYGAMA